MKSVSKFVKLNLAFIIVITVFVTTGCRSEDKLKSETLVLSVDDSKVYLDEMMYHLMLAEMQGQLYASFVGNDENYWDIKNEEGVPMSEAMKAMAMENAIKYELFYQLALQEGYVLTAEEKELSKNKVDNIMKSVKPEQLHATELSEEKLRSIQEKITLITRYYEDYLTQLGVDEAAIKGKFNSVDYKQYDIQYIYAQKSEYDKLASLLEIAKTSKDLTTLTKDTDLAIGAISFLEGDDTFGEETNLEEAITSMKVEEVSNIIETVKGYYIILLTNDTSTKKFDAVIKEQVEKAIAEVFEPAYETLKKRHQIKIKNKVWDPIQLGNATL